MQYKLIYIKIDATNWVAGVGMAGDVMMVFSMLSNITDEDILYVDMETHECVCTEKDILIDGTKNGWEYYFTQGKLDLAKEVITKTIFETGTINFRYGDKTLGSDLSLFLPWRQRFYKNFQLKPVLSDFVNKYYEENIKGRVTLGIQIRLTDQLYNHHTKSAHESIAKALEILKEVPSIERVFLATDDDTIIPLVEKALPIPVLYHKGFFRADEKNRLTGSHDKLVYVRPLHRYQTSLECLWDVFTLTKCDYLLKADVSAVSIISCLLAENIKKVYWL